MLLNVCSVSTNIQHITIEIVFVFCKLLRECMCTLIANSEFVRNFSYDFKAVPCVSLPFTTASVFRKWSGFGVTLHLTLLDMRLGHVHCSVTFCSLKITQMLGPVWLCSLGEAGCLAIFISTPRNPPPPHTHTPSPASLRVCDSWKGSCVSHFISFEVWHVPSFLACSWSSQSLSATGEC